MEKEDSRLKVLAEIRKERVGAYPYFIVAATYSAHAHHFVVAADYRSETAELWLYPFRDDMTRLPSVTLLLTDILPRKIIATIHVVSLLFRPASPTAPLAVSQAEFVLGYRSGQLVVVEYKDRECRVKQRLNRALKGEGFFSRASSAIFGGEDTYAPFLKAPIRSFRVDPFSPDYYHTWQVGNTLMLQRELSEEREARFFARYEAIDLENFHLHYDINKVIREGEFYCYGCDYYSLLEHGEHKMALLSFREEVNSFAGVAGRQELVVGLASKEEILVLDYAHFVLKGVIRLEIPLRNLGCFSSDSQDFLVLMPYENHIILYNLSAGTYCKLRGHKSFVASAAFGKDGRLLTAGMDHRICFITLASIARTNWVAALKEADNGLRVKEFDIPEQKFEEIYHLGEYNNSRNNQSSYGYASLLELNGYYCFATYDSKIILYSLK